MKIWQCLKCDAVYIRDARPQCRCEHNHFSEIELPFPEGQVLQVCKHCKKVALYPAYALRCRRCNLPTLMAVKFETHVGENQKIIIEEALDRAKDKIFGILGE